MKSSRDMLLLLILLALVAGCGPTPTPAPPTPTAIPVEPTATAVSEEPLYLAIIWHQHQPLYYKDPQTGVYAKPWVRAHATKDYYDMCAMLQSYPKIKATFNLTPSLLKQLQDFVEQGAKDYYWVLAEKPASELTIEEKGYILRRFFDANPTNVIGRFPRYKALMAKRGSVDSDADLAAAIERYSEQDFRDLQVWFNLAWFDPDFLATEPLKNLVDKGENFSEEDKTILFNEVRRVMAMVIPIHKQLQDAGQIEVTMTPYTHPILPLLYDTNLAKIGMPDASLPTRFSFPNDAIAQVQKGVERYRQIFGRDPRGMWPAEGAVAQQIVKIVSDAGIVWMASGEQVLAKSIGLESFTRDANDVVQQADQLYRPYYVREGDGRPVGMVFRDLTISDMIGFRYSGMDGAVAAKDFMARLRAAKNRLKQEGATGPHLLTVLLDGENAWEYYKNDGKKFLHEMYRLLSEATDIVTITPSEYLAKFPDQRAIETLWAGCWFTPDYSTWIGEDEENTAWEYLLRVRNRLIHVQNKLSPEALNKALEAMYAAEGSDWFWWYGADQTVADEGSFDIQFRQTLMDVYAAIGEPIPDFLYVPIMPAQSPPPARAIAGMFTPTIDGVADDVEWADAGYYDESGGAMARADDTIKSLYYGFDKKNIYLRVDGRSPWATFAEDLSVSAYFGVPRTKQVSSFSRYGGAEPRTVLGFGAAVEVAVNFSAGQVTCAVSRPSGGQWGRGQPLDTFAVRGEVLELAVPYDVLGELEAGDKVPIYVVVSRANTDIDTAPSGGPAMVIVPDISAITPVLVIDDPAGDDNGPGTYTYPTDSVFKPQVFDLAQFTAGYDEKGNAVFTFVMYGPIQNVWGSGNGLSVQAFDVYIDVDHQPGSGRRLLLPGRNAAVASEDAWDYAIWAEGWTPGVFKVGADGNPLQISADMKIVVDPVLKKATVRVPLAALGGGDPTTWGYLAAVCGQEGYPAPGVWRLRDVEPMAAQWRFGGGPADTNHTRIIDLALPVNYTPDQATLLSKYSPSQEPNMDKLTPDDFAQVPMMRVQ